MRNKIAGVFHIPKKKSTHVADNIVVDDGYYMEDVESALTGDAIRAHLSTDEKEPQVLWNMLIESLTPVPIAIISINPTAVVIPVVVAPEPVIIKKDEKTKRPTNK